MLKINQFSLIVFTFICGSLLFANSVSAQTPLIVDFIPDPLFGGNNFLPGDSAVGEVKATNNATENKRVATEAIDYPVNSFGNIPSDDLSRALIITIREKNGNDIYGGSSSSGTKTLFDFYENGETYLSDVSVNETAEYEFEIYFPESKGDEWQEKTTEFDIIIGFQGEEGGIIPGTNPGGGGGGLPPGLIIKNVRTYNIPDGDICDDFATVGFSWFTSYNATSQIIYSSECEYNGTCTTGNKEYKLDLSDDQWSSETPPKSPKYGYAHTTFEYHTPAKDSGVTYRGESDNEIKIEGLACSTTYYYRAISHASPPTISRIYSFTTPAKADSGNEDEGDAGGKDDGDTIPPSQEESDSEEDPRTPTIQGAVDVMSDFIDSIIGDETKEKTEGKIAGTEDEEEFDKGNVIKTNDEMKDKCEEYPDYLLWLIVLLLLIIAVLLYYILRKRREEKNKQNNT